ncbi:MAG: DUF721 domain-containing protein [bacterium]
MPRKRREDPKSPDLPFQKGPTSLRETIEIWLKVSGSYARIREADAVRRWGEAVGETIAKVTQPLSIKNGVLRVKVLNPSWKNELFYLRAEIREKINTMLNEEIVKEVKFV